MVERVSPLRGHDELRVEPLETARSAIALARIWRESGRFGGHMGALA